MTGLDLAWIRAGSAAPARARRAPAPRRRRRPCGTAAGHRRVAGPIDRPGQRKLRRHRCPALDQHDSGRARRAANECGCRPDPIRRRARAAQHRAQCRLIGRAGDPESAGDLALTDRRRAVAQKSRICCFVGGGACPCREPPWLRFDRRDDGPAPAVRGTGCNRWSSSVLRHRHGLGVLNSTSMKTNSKGLALITVVLDADRPEIGASGHQRGQVLALAIVDRQVAGGHRHDDLVIEPWRCRRSAVPGAKRHSVTRTRSLSICLRLWPPAAASSIPGMSSSRLRLVIPPAPAWPLWAWPWSDASSWPRPSAWRHAAVWPAHPCPWLSAPPAAPAPVEREAVGVGARQRGVDLAVAHIGPVAAAIQPDGAALGVRTDFAQQLRAAPPAGLGLGQQGHRAVQPDIQYVVVGRQAR